MFNLNSVLKDRNYSVAYRISTGLVNKVRMEILYVNEKNEIILSTFQHYSSAEEAAEALVKNFYKNS